MKLLIYADPHVSTYSSLLRSRDEKYSTRLTGIIRTLNWIEQTALDNECDRIICLGDFFNESDVTAECLTALKEVTFSNIPHYFLVGNHEMGRGTLNFSSAHLFESIPNFKVIDAPVWEEMGEEKFLYLPYILERERQPLKTYFLNEDSENLIIFSHNDIAGITLGKFVSKEGFAINEINECCKLFINGHLHNQSFIGDKIINLGNITGQNFSEDAFKYPHQIMLLDTQKRVMDFKENPYAFYFYQFSYTDKFEKILTLLRPNSIVSIQVPEKYKQKAEELIEKDPHIIASRIFLDLNEQNEIKKEHDFENIKINHVDKFIEYVRQNIGTSNLIEDELEKVINHS